MKADSPTDVLTRDIMILETKRAGEMADLRWQFQETLESFKPINLIKSTLKDVAQSPEIKGDMRKAAIGVTAGYLIKRMVFAPTANPLKKLVGFAFQTLVTNFATKNADTIKEKSFNIYEILKTLVMSRKKVDEENRVPKF